MSRFPETVETGIYVQHFLVMDLKRLGCVFRVHGDWCLYLNLDTELSIRIVFKQEMSLFDVRSDG